MKVYKNIRVEVSYELYHQLLDIQQEMRGKEGKKTSLGDIFVQYFYKSQQNDQNEEDSVQNGGNSVQNRDNSDQNSPHSDQNELNSVQNQGNSDQFFDQNEFFSNEIKKLEYRERSHNLRESGLDVREADLIKQEEDVQRRVVESFKPQIELIKAEGKFLRKQDDCEFKNLIIEDLEKELKESKTEASKLKERIIQYEERIMFSIENLERNEEAKQPIMDVVMKFATPIISILGVIWLKKGQKDNDFSSIKNEISSIMKNFKPEEQSQPSRLTKNDIE